jgi:hypothetical protein
MMPSRANSTTPISTSPSQNCQYCGLMPDSRWCIVMKTIVPSSAPYRLPVPPSTRININSAEREKLNTSIDTNCVVCVSKAPATPA